MGAKKYLGHHDGNSANMGLWLTVLTKILGDSNEGNIVECMTIGLELLDCVPGEDREGTPAAVSMTLGLPGFRRQLAHGGSCRWGSCTYERGQLLLVSSTSKKPCGGADASLRLTNPLPRTVMATKTTQLGRRQELLLPSKSRPPPTSASGFLVSVMPYVRAQAAPAPPSSRSSKFQLGTATAKRTAPLPYLRITPHSSSLDSPGGGGGAVGHGNLDFLSRYF
jgi:hypothetical protein